MGGPRCTAEISSNVEVEKEERAYLKGSEVRKMAVGARSGEQRLRRRARLVRPAASHHPELFRHARHRHLAFAMEHPIARCGRREEGQADLVAEE